MTENALSTDRLAELVAQKRQVLVQLRQVGVRQGELVDAGDVSTLLKLLGAKQTLLNGLRAIEASLAPFHEQDPDARAWPTPESRAACAADAQQCSRLLEEVMRMEREQERRMSDQRDRIARQLRAAHAAGEAAGAYGRHERAAPPSGTAAPMGYGTEETPARLDLTSGQ